MLREGKGGVYLNVKVQPNSGRAVLVGEREGHLLVRLQSPPEKGKANRELLQVLRKSLGLQAEQIHLVRGEKSRKKLIFLKDVELEELREALQTVLAKGMQ